MGRRVVALVAAAASVLAAVVVLAFQVHATKETVVPPEAGQAARGASEASESADEPPPRPSLGGTFYPPDLPPRASPAMLEKRRAVTEAYDVGDYEAAFRNA